MSTHAARTEAPGADHAPAPNPPAKMDPIQRAEYLAREATWMAAEIAERDRRDRCSHQGLPVYAEPAGPMLAAYAKDHDTLTRLAQLAEWARDELLKKQAGSRARQRNASR